MSSWMRCGFTAHRAQQHLSCLLKPTSTTTSKPDMSHKFLSPLAIIKLFQSERETCAMTLFERVCLHRCHWQDTHSGATALSWSRWILILTFYEEETNNNEISDNIAVHEALCTVSVYSLLQTVGAPWLATPYPLPGVWIVSSYNRLLTPLVCERIWIHWVFMLTSRTRQRQEMSSDGPLSRVVTCHSCWHHWCQLIVAVQGSRPRVNKSCEFTL